MSTALAGLDASDRAGREYAKAAESLWNRDVVYEFFRFINKRHEMFKRRFLRHEPPPWTSDPTLRDVFFTNVYRELDRGTRYLLVNITPKAKLSPKDGFFNVVLYRFFNLPWTYELLGGFRPYTEWNPDRVLPILLQAQASGEKIFTGAYMINYIPFEGAKIKGKGSKAELVVNRITALHRDMDKLWELVSLRGATMGSVHSILCGYPGIAGFNAYEMVVDMAYEQAILPFSEDDWVHPGPGCIKGLDEMVTPETSVSPVLAFKLIAALRWTQSTWFKHASVLPNGPPLTLRNVEHSLCEFSKYRRASRGDRPKRSFQHRLATVENLALWDSIPEAFRA